MSLLELEAKFRTRISPYIKDQIAHLSGEESQRIALQFTPDSRELALHADFIDDPLHEEDSDIHPFPDVIHKYPNKILYLTTDECPVYCRYCTRKRKTLLSPGHQGTALASIAQYLHGQPNVTEVIFSGGDPLMLPTSDLLKRVEFFLGLPTIRFIRFHTRAVTTAPNLISQKFVDGLRELRNKFSSKAIVFVLHVNTAEELAEMPLQKIALLRSLSMPLYSQSVLLKGVNDDPHVLGALFQALMATGVQPYYLHQLDRVTGAAHFEVEDERALAIYQELKVLVPRYMIPQLVRDSKQGKSAL